KPREAAGVIESIRVSDDLAAVGGTGREPGQADGLALEDLERLSGRIVRPRGRREGRDEDAAEDDQAGPRILGADREVPDVRAILQILLRGPRQVHRPLGEDVLSRRGVSESVPEPPDSNPRPVVVRIRAGPRWKGPAGRLVDDVDVVILVERRQRVVGRRRYLVRDGPEEEEQVLERIDGRLSAGLAPVGIDPRPLKCEVRAYRRIEASGAPLDL